MQEKGGYFMHDVDQMLTKLTNGKSRRAYLFSTPNLDTVD